MPSRPGLTRRENEALHARNAELEAQLEAVGLVQA